MLTRSYLTIVLTIVFLIKANISLASSGDVHQLIISSIEHFNNVRDYTCRLDKRVRKNGILYEEIDIYVKHMRPANYYFRWNRGIQKGQEVIFAKGKNNGKIVAHPGGILNFITLQLDPEGSIAMMKNRHSLINSGMGKIMSLIETTYKQSRDAGLEAVRYIGEEQVDNRTVLILEGKFPQHRGYYAHRIIISFDKELKLPIEVSVYDWSNKLVEEYLFRNLEINVGYSDSDFDPYNPEYRFIEDIQ